MRKVIGASPVVLLTATPIQNSLAELWGLAQYVDPTGTLLGAKPVFEDVVCAGGDGRGVAAEQARELRRRLGTVIQRTLRRQAHEFLDKPFVGRRAQLFQYRMSAAERTLYDDVTDYLLRPRLHAFQGRSRQLLIGFHRRMASSTAALAASLGRVASRLRARLAGESDPEAAAAFTGDLEDDPPDVAPAADDGASAAEAEGETKLDSAAAREELALVDFARRAQALPRDGKADSLVKAVRLVMARPEDHRKVVIFTESLTTQDYLRKLLLEQTQLVDADITLFRGVNDSARALGALGVWREEVEPEPAVGGPRSHVSGFRFPGRPYQ